MKKEYAIILLFFFVFASIRAQEITGTVYYHNSNRKPAKGVEISASGCNPVYSKDDGTFILKCAAYNQIIELGIGSKDGNNQNITLTNSDDLNRLIIKKNEVQQHIKIYVAVTETLNEKTAKTLARLEKNLFQKVERLESKMEKEHSNFSKRIEKLEDQMYIKETLEELAQLVANTNKETASEVVKPVIENIENGGNLEDALGVFNTSQLEKEYQSILTDKIVDEHQIKQVLKGYELKIKLLVSSLEYEKAIVNYQKSIDILLHTNSNQHQLGVLYYDLAYIHEKLGKYEEALDYTKKSIEILKQLVDPENSDLAMAYYVSSNIYMSLGQFKNALDNSNKAIAIKEKMKQSDKDLALTYEIKAYALLRLEEPEEALQYDLKALDILEGIVDIDPMFLAFSYNGIALDYREIEECEQAYSYMKKAVKITEENVDPQHIELAFMYGNFGKVYKCLFEYEKALQFELKGLAILEKKLSPKHPSIGVLYDNLALTYQLLNQYDKALEFQLKALVISNETLAYNHPNLEVMYSNIALSYQVLGQFDNAIKYYEKSIRLLEASSKKSKNSALASTYHYLGQIYTQVNKPWVAITAYQKAVDYWKKELEGNHLSLGVTYEDIARVYYSMRLFDKSLSYNEQVLEIQKQYQGENHPALAGTYENIGYVYQALGKSKKAKSYFKKALEQRQ